MKTAIVILNYNDSENTIKFVNDIKEYSTLDTIVVVDNNSTKENEFIKLKNLQSDKIHVIKSDKNGGYAYGNNYGLKYIEKLGIYDFVIISNPDVAVKEEAIKECVEFLKNNNEAAIVTPRMHFVSGPARRAAWKKRTIGIDMASSTRFTEALFYPVFKKGEYSKKEYENNVLEVDVVAGAFFVAKFSILKKIGYFDENTFLFYEEDIIGDKVKKAGFKIYLLNDISFMHYDSQTIGKLMKTIKKIEILFDSKIYYHKTYNNANRFQIRIFKMLREIRKFEVFITNLFKKH